MALPLLGLLLLWLLRNRARRLSSGSGFLFLFPRWIRKDFRLSYGFSFRFRFIPRFRFFFGFRTRFVSCLDVSNDSFFSISLIFSSRVQILLRLRRAVYVITFTSAQILGVTIAEVHANVLNPKEVGQVLWLKTPVDGVDYILPRVVRISHMMYLMKSIHLIH